MKLIEQTAVFISYLIVGSLFGIAVFCFLIQLTGQTVVRF